MDDRSRAVLNESDALQIAMRLLIESTEETHNKELCQNYFNDSVDATIVELDALKAGDVSASGLPLFFADFRAFSGAILQLQLPTVARKSTSCLNGNDNEAKEVIKLPRNKLVDVSVYHEARKRILNVCICDLGKTG